MKKTHKRFVLDKNWKEKLFVGKKIQVFSFEETKIKKKFINYFSSDYFYSKKKNIFRISLKTKND